MTNKEAINVLLGQENAYWDTLSEAEHKAFELAAVALTVQQPRVLTLEENHYCVDTLCSLIKERMGHHENQAGDGKSI